MNLLQSLMHPIFVSIVLAALWSAPAQSAPPAADEDARRIEDLVATLEDDARRAELVAELRLLLEARRAAEPGAAAAGLDAVDDLFSGVVQRIETVGSRLRKSFGALRDLPAWLRELRQRAERPATRDRWIEMGWKIVLVFASGLAARLLMTRLLRRRRRSEAVAAEIEEAPGLLRLATGIFLELLPLVVFAGVAAGLLTLLDPRPVTRVLALALIAAFFCERLICQVSAALLLRRDDRPPPLAIGGESAGYLYVWIRRLSIIGVYGYFAVRAAAMLSFPAAAQSLLESSFGLLLAALLAVFVLQNRAPMAAWIRGPRDAPAGGMRAIRAFVAGIWAPVALLCIVAGYGIFLFSVKGGFQFLLRGLLLTLAVIVAARVIEYLAGAALRRASHLKPELRLRYPELEQRVNRYMPLIGRIIRVFIYAVALLSIVELWGFGVYGWFESESGRLLLARLLRIFLILAGALLVWETLSAFVQHRLERHDPDNGAFLPVSPRARTLLPLFRNLMLIVIGAMAGISVLAELGINIAPLLAGAGVVGLAIGVGAQSLVKDVITGIFIIFEDSIGLGDIADIGGHIGVVEGITIRTLRLRDLDGVVHTVPFGNISEIRNLTKDFSYAVVEIGVGYGEDVDAVIGVLQEVGAEMRADAEFGALILEPMEVLGLDSFGASSVNIRIRFKTEASSRWSVRREFNRRVKKAFDRRGIEIPFPQRTVHFAGAPPAAGK